MADPNAPAGGDNPFVTTQQTTTPPAVEPPPPEVGPNSTGTDGPQPQGISAQGAEASQDAASNADAEKGRGIEGEETMWEARYSAKNFLGRFALRLVATAVWVAIAYYTWGERNTGVSVPAWVFGVALALYWLAFLYRFIHARYGHYYTLTNRRLFIDTGLFRRRRDQMELIHIKDVFTRQSLIERWLTLGTVVVASNEKALPTFYLLGVNDPQQVMDLVWHHARSERDKTTLKIES